MPKAIANGFHGTTRTAAQQILDNGFSPSQNKYDWLGDGIYFFQDAPHRALEWAAKQFSEPVCVVAAKIELVDFIDLLDIDWSSWLAKVFDRYLSDLKKAGHSLPVQRGGAHSLDRAVLNYAVEVLESEGYRVRGIRGAFAEGHPVFPNSALLTHSHVQIAVRDRDLISDVRVVGEKELGRG